MTYEKMHEFLRSRKMTHEDMQGKWDSLKESNWKVKNLSEHGKNWTDLNELALDSLLKLTENANQGLKP